MSRADRYSRDPEANRVGPCEVRCYDRDGKLLRTITSADLQARKVSPVPESRPPSTWIKRDPLPLVAQRRRTATERDDE